MSITNTPPLTDRIQYDIHTDTLNHKTYEAYKTLTPAYNIQRDALSQLFNKEPTTTYNAHNETLRIIHEWDICRCENTLNTTGGITSGTIRLIQDDQPRIDESFIGPWAYHDITLFVRRNREHLTNLMRML